MIDLDGPVLACVAHPQVVALARLKGRELRCRKCLSTIPGPIVGSWVTVTEAQHAEMAWAGRIKMMEEMEMYLEKEAEDG